VAERWGQQTQWTLRRIGGLAYSRPVPGFLFLGLLTALSMAFCGVLLQSGCAGKLILNWGERNVTRTISPRADLKVLGLSYC
jgi:hypothetical protein